MRNTNAHGAPVRSPDAAQADAGSGDDVVRPRANPRDWIQRIAEGRYDEYDTVTNAKLRQAGLRKKKVQYHKVEISLDGAGGKETSISAQHLLKSLQVRKRFQDRVEGTVDGMESEGGKVAEGTKFYMVDGIVCFDGETLAATPYDDYVTDFREVSAAVENGPTKSVCRNRLKILDEKYAIYIALNTELEENQCPIRKGGGVFSDCVKVDNSVRLSTAMHAHSLLDYMVYTFENQPNTVVGKNPDGTAITLKDMYHKFDITDPRTLTVEGVGLHPPVQKRFHRFDIFSKEYNKGGERSAELLKLYLKRDGPFYHNLVRPILKKNDVEFVAQRVATEFKLPIFGSSKNEWKSLAKWVSSNGLGGYKRNRWIIQIPRIAALRVIFTNIATTQEQLDNIFLPLWEASLDPGSEENKDLAALLAEVGAFNVIADESTRGSELPQYRPPAEWPWQENPPDLYFNYYMWANIVKLNHLRRRNGLNTYTFRPNCGEAGKIDQLVMGFMLASSINHGLTMERSTVLQYLFYISQTGIVLSPLASNGLGNPAYSENPFLKYQKRGMRVSLGTEDPLHYHHSTRPCIEEYGTASKIYKLGPVDMTEIARNSALSSGFGRAQKQEWLGEGFELENQAQGNDAKKSFVPDVRLSFRDDTLSHEKAVLQEALLGQGKGDIDAYHQRKHSHASHRRQSLRSTSISSVGKACNITEEDIAFPRVDIVSPVVDADSNDPTINQLAQAAIKIAECQRLRIKYIDLRPELDDFLNLQSKSSGNDQDEFKADVGWECIPKTGVYRYKRKGDTADKFEPEGLSSLSQFFRDFNTVHDIVEDIHVKAMCHRRLQVLEHKFQLHMALNIQLENAADDGGQSRDFYQAPKVDTHIHAAAGMTARQLLEFILAKARDGLDDIVQVDKGQNPVTLKQLFGKMGIRPDNLTVDSLNVQADATLFERFDNFNDKYNPMGIPDLRNLLLKTDNYMGGRYFAEIAKSTFAQFARDEYTYAEMRLSVYGRHISEWTKLASWFDTHGMSSKQNKWMIQAPRIYPIFRKHGTVSSFQGVLTNFFEPLWNVSLNPASDPKLHHFLKHVSGFDSVDNESSPDLPFPADTVPSEWTSHDNPPYGYWMYFMWANITSLNTFRKSRGLTTFQFRPHCGESGSPDHLMYCHLTANQINHGVNLRRDPVLEYMYYISQMGIAVSPLSNNSLFLDILQNPFPMFFRRGLNVSLSTDDPLQFHYTQEPLIEEYSIASKVWKLNANDMCEIARNSVIQSGFHPSVKSGLIGETYLLSSSRGNDAKKTHLSNIRVAYRFEAYHAELFSLEEAAGKPIFDGLRAKFTVEEEVELQAEGKRRRRLSLKDFLVEGDAEVTEEQAIERMYLENLELKAQLAKAQEGADPAAVTKADALCSPRVPAPAPAPPPAVRTTSLGDTMGGGTAFQQVGGMYMPMSPVGQQSPEGSAGKRPFPVAAPPRNGSLTWCAPPAATRVKHPEGGEEAAALNSSGTEPTSPLFDKAPPPEEPPRMAAAAATAPALPPQAETGLAAHPPLAPAAYAVHPPHYGAQHGVYAHTAGAVRVPRVHDASSAYAGPRPHVGHLPRIGLASASRRLQPDRTAMPPAGMSCVAAGHGWDTQAGAPPPPPPPRV